MKLPTFSAVVTLTFTPAIHSMAGPDLTASQPMRDAVTHNHLSRTLSMAQQSDPIREMGPAIGKADADPAAGTETRDLIKESTILCYGGFLTLIPKQAVLHLPPKLKARFEVQPNIKVQTWADFYQANRGWIRTIEVTRSQAMGEVAMPEEVLESFKTSSSAVVATYKGGPISVLPVPEPKPKTEGEADTAGITLAPNTPKKNP